LPRCIICRGWFGTTILGNLAMTHRIQQSKL